MYLFPIHISNILFQKTVPCNLCKEVLTVVAQILKDNATEVRQEQNVRIQIFNELSSGLQTHWYLLCIVRFIPVIAG